MAIEIERKYLIDLDKIGILKNGNKIKHGYVSINKNTVVWVRVKNDKGYLIIKGSNNEVSRLEFKYEVPLVELNERLDKLCQKIIINKIRSIINLDKDIWEIDVFYGDNEGLVVSEIELKDEMKI